MGAAADAHRQAPGRRRPGYAATRTCRRRRGRRRARRPALLLRARLMARPSATASVKPGPLGTCALTILDKDCGLAHGVAGGSTFASVIEQRVGPGQPAR